MPNPLLVVLMFMLLPFAAVFAQPLLGLERVRQQGEITVLTRNTGTTYYDGGAVPTGLEYDLVTGFAQQLGVKVRFIIADNVAEVVTRLRSGDADMAAAALSVTQERKRWFRFTPAYQVTSQLLVYRKGSKPPRNLGDLNGMLEVAAHSSHAENLRIFSDMYPRLAWKERADLDTEDLLTRVWDGEIGYTIVDSREFQRNQRYYPEVESAFEIANSTHVAWAFPKSGDDTLFRAASGYVNQLKESGALEYLLERHYGHLNDFDYVGARTFLRHAELRLPAYQQQFLRAGENYGIDWRLLAAMAYQESHWDRHAVSPTGVRGLMMVTEATAALLGLSDRTDPAQSIDGGARYLQWLLATLPSHIPNPDRLWLALAAYNIGYGHLNDARLLTERLGGNPDSWKDVKVHLPLLRQNKWYTTLKHGYARGDEAYQYVENIRSYYDILVRLDEKQRQVFSAIRDLPWRPQVFTVAQPGGGGSTNEPDKGSVPINSF